MFSLTRFTRMALSLPDAIDLLHFHLQSFRVTKKIFATLHEKDNRAMLKLPLADQSVFCSYDENVFFLVPGAWGQGGATFVDLKKIKKAILKEALEIAYNNAAKKK